MFMSRAAVALSLWVICYASFAQLPSPTLLVVATEDMGALSASGGSKVIVHKGDLAVNSKHDWAVMPTDSTIRVENGALKIVGGIHADAKSVVAPKARTGVASAQIPVGESEWPAADRIASAEELFLVSNTETTLKPGVYRGGINASGTNLKVHLEPGAYFLHQGSLFLSGAEVDGEGVTIVLYGDQTGALTLTNGAKLRLSAPREGGFKDLAVIVGGRSEGIQMGFRNCTAEIEGVVYGPVSEALLSQEAQVKASAFISWQLMLLDHSQLEITGERAPQ